MFSKFQRMIPSEIQAAQLDRTDGGAQQRVFPPDFVHGNAELDELYGSFEGWADRLVFVRSMFVGGQCVAASVAYFDDWFLTVEHRRCSADEAIAWVKSLSEQRAGVVIELGMDRSLRQDADEWIVVQCDRECLEATEVTELDVTRDSAMLQEPWWQTAQIDLLSTVCLTARLGRLH